MTALEFLKYLRGLSYLPVSASGELPCHPPSSSEIKRWLRTGTVILNGSRAAPDNEVAFPITKLIFFPEGKRKTTIIEEKQ